MFSTRTNSFINPLQISAQTQLWELKAQPKALINSRVELASYSIISRGTSDLKIKLEEF